MSRVFLAVETRLGRQVVIKVLPPEMGAGVNTERFEREIRLAAQLQHPHIVPLLTAGASGDLLYYVMPYIAGESLRVKLAREGELPVAEAVRILREVVDALAYAHRRGVVHRDIKPDNVLLSEGHAVVTDFGVAKALAVGQHAEGARTLRGPSGITSLGVALGTPAYMAPEQAAADPHVDHRADIYAVGTLAYEMLAGRVPFEAPTPQAMLAAHLTATPDPVSQHRRSVPPALNAVIMRCLEKRAADRWQSAGEVASQLDAIATPSGGMAPSSAALPPVAVSSGTEAAIRRGHPARIAALFAGASAGVLGAVYLLVQQLGLPDWVFLGAAVLLLVGLPVMLLTGHLERRRAEARASGRAQPTPTGALHRFLTWRKALMGGALAFAALGLVTTGYTAMRLLGVGPVGTLVAAGRLAQRDKLIVADFENRTADQTLGASVTEAFRIDLSQSPMVAVVPTAAVVEALGRMQRPAGTGLTPVLAREVAVREGAKAVVAGEISAVGRDFVLAVRLLDAGDGTELVALRETAEDDGAIVPAIDRLSGRLRERIGESLRTIRAGAPLEQVTTGSLAALRLYSEAARLSDQGEHGKAIPLLEQALQADSTFAMAWRKLAVALGNARASFARQVAATTRAYQLRDRLPVHEREYTTAYYYSTVDFNPAEAEAAYRRILALDPGSYIAVNNLSLHLIEHGRYAEAESLSVAGLARDSGIGNLWLQVLNAELGQGRWEAARRTLEALRRRAPASPVSSRARAVSHAVMGQWDSAQRAWLDLSLQVREPSYQSAAHQGLALVALTRGRLAEAEREFRLDNAVNLARGLPGEALGNEAAVARLAAQFRGDSAGARRVLERALERHPLASIPELERPYALLATAYLAAGRPAEARRLLAEYEAGVPQGVRRGDWQWYRARGYLALADERPGEAIASFRAIREAGCAVCGDWDLGLAYERAGMADSALAAFTRAAAPEGTGWSTVERAWGLAPSLKRLGELYEARGDRERASEAYRRFLELWRDPDPVLQATVREVQSRLARLAGEDHR
jgi:serine/threonine-protein kinase